MGKGPIGEGLDRRIVPVRDDLAAAHLKGEVDAPAYAEGTAFQVTASVLPIRKAPDEAAMQLNQALFGETFTVFDEAEGWAWGQLSRDGYVGYVDVEGLSQPVVATTHRVTALRTYRFSKPDLKSAPLGLVTMNARLALGGDHPLYREDHRGGFVWHGHVAEDGEGFAEDPVAVAEQYLGAPYFWGGSESLGLDCSGLVQNAFAACGVAVPRDADMQEAHFGGEGRAAALYDQTALPNANWQSLELQRGDILFWPGHVALMVDEDLMIHANATHMATTIDDARALSAKWAEEKNLQLRRIFRPSI